MRPLSQLAVASIGISLLLAQPLPGATQTNVTVRVMAANLTSGTIQCYEQPGINIFQGLKPDIVAIQEFSYISKPSTPAQIRSLVDTAFGTNFVYYREPNAGYSIPNGIISRYPILASGSWEDVDPGVNDRGFAWARIDLPGTNDLYVVSVHLKASSGDSARRATEATNLTTLIQSSFPSDAWIIVAGDLNISDPGEPALAKFKTYLGDSPIPTDAQSGGDPDTNAGRSERYDYVLPSFSLTNTLTPAVFPSRTFNNGLVFDSRVYTPLSDVPPVLSTDSGASGMQHMSVVKDFKVTYELTNGVTNPPVITTHPQSQTVTQGNNATFSVIASGTEPLSYQWRFNEVNIGGATGTAYTRSNVQPAHAGNYAVVVTNSTGTESSSNAALSLYVPRPVLTIQSPDIIRWRGLSNLDYTVQVRTNFESTNWQTLGTAASPTATVSFTNPASGDDQRFYRVIYP